MQIDLHIGGLGVRLEARQALSCVAWPLLPFETFLRSLTRPPDLFVTVTVVERLPDLPRGALRFDACHGLWKLFGGPEGSGYILESADTATLAPRTRSIVSTDFSRVDSWILYHRGERGEEWVPMHLFNPLIEICLVTRVSRAGGLVLHASGVLDHGSVCVFTGPSGAGKSTISDLFASRGASVLSDERVIIRRNREALAVWGTPWVGASRCALNRTGSLTDLYFIRHGQGRHQVERRPPRAVAPALLQQCFLPLWDHQGMTGVLGVLDALADRVPCWDLAFLKHGDIVDFLEEQPAGPLVRSSW